MIKIKTPLHLFQAYGVELEYMIVDRDTLSISPIADRLLFEVTGKYDDAIFDKTEWSNELVLHLIEMKTHGPVPNITDYISIFQEEVHKINKLLEKYSAQLLPTGAHPWMNPHDAKLWPHGCKEVYETYNRIFNCEGHGWSNVQSTHLNLAFADDEEFARLHAAIRLLLPIMPALSASTPIIEGQFTGSLDNRLHFYMQNQKKIPSITGYCIPEAVFNKKDYQKKILKRIYTDIAPFDPKKILQYEWLNSRGAIARFDRNTIELRILDVQECPLNDLAILFTVVEALKALIAGTWSSTSEQMHWSEVDLNEILMKVIVNGLDAVITNTAYLRIFAYTEKTTCTAGELWQHIINHLNNKNEMLLANIQLILSHGNLAERILKSLGKNFNKQDLKTIYQQLAICLQQGTMFRV